MILMTIDTTGQQFTVIGMLVASVPFFGSKYAEGISDVQGNTAPDVPRVLERRRFEALERLGAKADRVGADAVIGVRFDVREITSTWKEMCVYGTAVRHHHV